MNEDIRIVLVDDHHVVRKGVRLLFSTEPTFNVVGDFNCVSDTLDFLEDNSVDVIMCDITMPDVGGVELVKIVKKQYPFIKILMLTMHLDASYIVEVMEEGVDGYILKDAKEEEIIEGVKSVHAGQMYMVKSVSDVLSKALLSKNKINTQKKESGLTAREKEILKCIVDGLSNKMISAELSISERTVNAHRYNIMKKLNAKNSANLVRISLEKNLC